MNFTELIALIKYYYNKYIVGQDKKYNDYEKEFLLGQTDDAELESSIILNNVVEC